jgi:hypothetical protein
MSQIRLALMALTILSAATGAQAQNPPEWSGGGKGLSFAEPDSDVYAFLATCEKGKVIVDIKLRPPKGAPGDKTPITFIHGEDKAHYTATLTDLEGSNGDNVIFAVPPSAKLFDFMQRDGAVTVLVPGQAGTMPAKGRAEATRAFRERCR